MNKAFAGLCIDGPSAGTLMECETAQMTLRLNPTVLAHAVGDMNARVETESFAYSFHEALPDVLGKPYLRFWVPSDWPAEERTQRVLRVLVERYHESLQPQPSQ